MTDITEIKKLLNNKLIKNLGNLDWGRTIAPFNEMIIKNIYKDQETLEVNGENSGYDLIVNGQRIQCKVRQVDGDTPFSKSVYLSTTRRHSVKNFHKNVNGQVCYSDDEFDFLFVTLVWAGNRDVNDWYATLIPVDELKADRKGNLKTSVSAKLLKQYEVKDFFN